MFEVSVEQTFAAGHALRNYRARAKTSMVIPWSGDPGGCALDQTGMLVDFLDVKASMLDVIAKLDHRFLNEIPPFDAINPSAENIAEYFYQQMSSGLASNPVPVRIREIRVWETDIQSATYRP
jgi:6-pyruvoyltetrahydropterin/6-carboxytetrahydropterin synthase